MPLRKNMCLLYVVEMLHNFSNESHKNKFEIYFVTDYSVQH